MILHMLRLAQIIVSCLRIGRLLPDGPRGPEADGPLNSGGLSFRRTGMVYRYVSPVVSVRGSMSVSL